MKEISNELTFLSYVDRITSLFRFDIGKDGNIDYWDCIEYVSSDSIPRIVQANIPLKVCGNIIVSCSTALAFYAGGNIEYFEYEDQSQAYARLMSTFMYSSTKNPVYLICYNNEFQKIIDDYRGREVYVYVID